MAGRARRCGPREYRRAVLRHRRRRRRGRPSRVKRRCCVAVDLHVVLRLERVQVRAGEHCRQQQLPRLHWEPHGYHFEVLQRTQRQRAIFRHEHSEGGEQQRLSLVVVVMGFPQHQLLQVGAAGDDAGEQRQIKWPGQCLKAPACASSTRVPLFVLLHSDVGPDICHRVVFGVIERWRTKEESGKEVGALLRGQVGFDLGQEEGDAGQLSVRLDADRLLVGYALVDGELGLGKAEVLQRQIQEESEGARSSCAAGRRSEGRGGAAAAAVWSVCAESACCAARGW